MRNKVYDFSSVQINLPKALADNITEWGKEKISDDHLFNDPENLFFGREDDPHVTILYGIHSNKPQEAFDLLNYEKEIQVKLGEIYIFKESYWFDVVTIAVISPDLERLNAKFRSSLRYSNRHKKYIPHITIAYVTKKMADEIDECEMFKNQEFLADSVYFSSRTGQKHRFQLRSNR